MNTKSDLVTGGSSDLRMFVHDVTSLAIRDHVDGRKKKRKGQELVELTCVRYRMYHMGMATTIYNKTRLTLELMA